MSEDGGAWTVRLDREFVAQMLGGSPCNSLASYGAKSSVGLSLIEGMQMPGAVGYDVYSFGDRSVELIWDCPAHGRWSFPATDEGAHAAAEFAEAHADCVTPPPIPPRPPNKSRRRA